MDFEQLVYRATPNADLYCINYDFNEIVAYDGQRFIYVYTINPEKAAVKIK